MTKQKKIIRIVIFRKRGKGQGTTGAAYGVAEAGHLNERKT